MPSDPFSKALNRRISEIDPALVNDLSHIVSVNSEIAHLVLAVIVEDACQSQNAGVISIARTAASKMPTSWLESRLPRVIAERINLEDDWEYRRLLELLQIACPPLLKHYVEVGHSSRNPEIREAAEDFGKR